MGEEEEELEAIQRRKLIEMQRRILMEQQKRAEFEAQKQLALRTVLTPEARQRLANIKLVKPEFANQLELQLIQVAQTGRVQLPITDAQLKEILSKLQRKREIRITRK